VGTIKQHSILRREMRCPPGLSRHELAEDALAAASGSHASTADSDNLSFEEKAGLHVRPSVPA